MGEEDVTVEVSSERVLTISGSRKRAAPAGRRATADQLQAAEPADEERSPPEAAAADAAPAAAEAPAADGEAEAEAVVSYRFQRSFVLPDDADAEAVSAQLERGVLSVSVPRTAPAKPQARRVALNAKPASAPAGPTAGSA